VPRTVLLTGATGYVGGRLLRCLEKEGLQVRCLARRPEFLRGRVAPATEVVRGDLSEPASLGPALAGVDVAYYLVHSMGSAEAFVDADRSAARNFGRAAREAGVRRIVYLGGLGHGSPLSAHLESRHEVGRILRDSGVPTVELRASIVIGSGSLSFEMIRALVEKLPLMVTPRWTRALAQPIAIEDVLAYLVAALDVPLEGDGVYEIGGADRVSYADLMQEYARQRGLRRWIVPVPVLSPGLSSLWLGLVTPLYARVGRKLIESVRNDTVVTDERALRAFPVRPRGVAEAIARALVHEDRELAETRWSDALSAPGELQSFGGVTFGSRVLDSRTERVPCAPHDAMAPIRRIGGDAGWYAGDWLWRLRGFVDLLAGGVGMRRGRRDPEHLRVGDPLDFWRVEAYEPDRLLRLQAEMRLPGRAWLQFEIEPDGAGSIVRQTAIFDPVGLFGLVYWYALYPFHRVIFAGMLREIARRARAEAAQRAGA
jgi:uncharacterized protein YbjT (DUF2867 family)